MARLIEIGPRSVAHLARLLEPAIEKLHLTPQQYTMIVSDGEKVDAWRADAIGSLLQHAGITPATTVIQVPAGTTRLELLGKLQSLGVKLVGGTPQAANFDAKNDRPIEVRRVLTPDEVDAVFAKFGKELPWDGTLSQHGKCFTVVETLETLLRYIKARGTLPRPYVWWALRCSDPYGSGRSLGSRVRFVRLFRLDAGCVSGRRRLYRGVKALGF